MVEPIFDRATAIEYAQQFLSRVNESSNGLLNDRSPGSVLVAFGEAFGESLSLQQAINLQNITDQVNVAIPKLLGIEKRLGTKTTVSLSFELTNALSYDIFSIAKSYSVYIGNYEFFTDAIITIPSGSTETTVTATAANIGQTNISSSSTIRYQPIANLKSISLIGIIQPGTDAETDAQWVKRSTDSFRDRALISSADYERSITDYLGYGSIAKSIVNLGSDKISRQVGAVHSFALNANGSQLGTTQLAALQQILSNDSGWASVYVSNFDFLEIKISYILTALSGVNPTTLANLIDGRIKSFLRPSVALSEIYLYDLIAEVYKVVGVVQVGSISIDDGSTIYEAMNVPLPNDYTLPLVISSIFRIIVNGVTYVVNI